MNKTAKLQKKEEKVAVLKTRLAELNEQLAGLKKRDTQVQTEIPASQASRPSQSLNLSTLQDEEENSEDNVDSLSSIRYLIMRTIISLVMSRALDSMLARC